MLRSTFAHIPRIGLRTERLIWSAGVRTWDHALDREYCVSCLSHCQADTLHHYIKRSIVALDHRNLSMFTRLARFGESWRLYPELKEEALYLDIETTGFWSGNDITVIGTCAHNRFRAFVAGQNLKDFPKYVSQYSFVVTFNGSCFDVPVIEQHFPSLHLPFHFDLRYAANRCNLAGGLKRIERLLHIRRPRSIKHLDGCDAAVLWKNHLSGDRSALKMLLEYNECDVRNLQPIAETVCEQLSNVRAAEVGIRARARVAHA